MQSQNNQPRIIIIGGGFAGLELAKKLRGTIFDVILFDKQNFHTFQPLLYQVATGGLRIESIAYPFRKIFRKSKNVAFRMEEVIAVHPSRNQIVTTSDRLSYDYLVVATGSQSNFFNFTPVQKMLMPLKNSRDALHLRSFILQNFEKANVSADEELKEELINVAIVGGGPTGVELAGAIAEMKKYVFPQDFPQMDVEQMRIILFEAAPKLLGPMSEEASEHALKYLKEFGVEVYLNSMVDEYDGKVLKTKDGEVLRTNTVIWTAGVKGAFPDGFPKNCVAPAHRLKVDQFNRLEGFANIYALGDAAAMVEEGLPKGHPMLATVALQQARNLAQNLVKQSENKSPKPFEYRDKGTMATIGRNRAVVDLPRWKFQGRLAWFVWIFVHIFSLIGFRNKLAALWDWAYNFFTYDRAVQLIITPFERSRNSPHVASGQTKKQEEVTAK